MGRLRVRTGREEVKALDRVMDSSQRIARESSDSAYSLYSKGVVKTEIFGVGNSV